MKTRSISQRCRTLAVVLALGHGAACASPPAGGGDGGRGTPAENPRGWRLTYRLTGGLAGFDVTFTIAADGVARYERRRPSPESRSARLAPELVAELERLVRTSGFLELAETHAPVVPVSDGFDYEMVWEEAGGKKRTSAPDGAELPEAFVLVREAIAALERQVLASENGRGGGS